MELVLIDGNSLINRAFYATPVLTSPDGVPTNAVYAFLNMLFKIEKDLSPKYLLVAFDRREPTFRHKEYSEYKAGRRPMPEELAAQIPLLKEVLDAMGIARYEKAGFEADDIIGSFAKRFNVSTAIFTGDRDAFQLVDETTSVYFTKRGITDVDVYDAENFKEKFLINPCQVVDLKALMGDNSDNIKGVEGVGEKKAYALLQAYHDVETLYEHIDELTGKLRENVKKGKESAFFSKRLATICVDMPLETDLDDLLVKPLGEDAKKIFLKLGFTNILKKLNIDFEEEKKQEKSVEKVIIRSLEEGKKFLLNAKEFSFVYEDKINFYDGEKEYEITLKENFLGDGIDACDLGEIFKCFESDKKCLLIDKKKTRKALDEYGVELKCDCDDLSILKYLVDFTGREVNAKSLCEEYGYSIDTPAYAIAQITRELKEKLVSQKMEKLYYEMELPLCDVLYEMEKTGFKVDEEYLKTLEVAFDENLKRTLSEIYSYTGDDININSPKQLSEMLFVKLGLKGGKKLKNGSYSTKADVLEKLSGEHPVVDLILKYRKTAKLKSTYVDALLELAKNGGELIHTTFNQTLTSTGRLSSSEPNLQNIPVRTDEGKVLRKAFVSRFENGCIVSSDYSQIELRLLADFSSCKALIEAFKSGKDIHAQTASQVFGKKLEDVTPEERRGAKAVNFGIIYGISAFGLGESLKISPRSAQNYMDRYFASYPEVKEYMDANVDFARKNGYVHTFMGRKRYIKEINSSDKNLRAFGERAAMNMPLQGSSADIIKLAMIKVFLRLKAEKLQAKLILQIHDELVVDCPREERDAVEKILKEEMESITLNSVKLETDVNSGSNWYEVK